MAGRKAASAIERFNEKWQADESGCHLWTSGGTGNGYGLFNFKGRMVLAHRWIYAYKIGPLPEGHDVCHKCDVRACVNELHLFTGTRKQNMEDCVAKNRQKKGPEPKFQGENHHGARLTVAKVVDMRVCYKNGESLTALGKAFGVSVQQVFRIVNNQAWRHVE